MQAGLPCIHDEDKLDHYSMCEKSYQQQFAKPVVELLGVHVAIQNNAHAPHSALMCVVMLLCAHLARPPVPVVMVMAMAVAGYCLLLST